MIRNLEDEQLTEIYQKYMISDFPENELKSLAMIRNNIRSKECNAYGYFEDDLLLGYATVLIAEKILILDYFAILPDHRQKGYGLKFLNELFDHLKDYEALLIEAEVPEDEITERRIRFYHRAGCKDSGLCGRLYFVDYCLLYKDLSIVHTSKDIEEAIYQTYHLVYPQFENTKYLQFYRN